MSGEETTPPAGSPLANPDNEKLLRAVGNLVIEATIHRASLKSIYEVIRSAVEPATALGHVLITEYERHRDRTIENLASLKTAVG